MLTNEDFTDLVEDLNSKDVSLRAVALETFWKFPSKDKRVLPYLQHLLHDKTLCLLGIPYIFGEIRWLAAQALFAEQQALGIYEPVRLQNLVRPINMAGYSKARKAANITLRGGIEGVLENLAILRDMGCLPTYDLILWPPEPSQKQERLQPIPMLVPVL